MSDATKKVCQEESRESDGLKGLCDLWPELCCVVSKAYSVGAFVSNRIGKLFSAIFKRLWIAKDAAHGWPSSDNAGVFRQIWNFFKAIIDNIGLRSINFLRLAFHARTFSVAGYIFIYWVVSFVALDALDPFGISRVMETYTEEIRNRISSYWYGSSAQEKIVVVLLDSGGTVGRTGWPPRYSDYGAILCKILEDEPKAVFMDILLEKARTYDETLPLALENLGKTLKETGTPLIMAQANPKADNLFGSLSGVQTAMVQWRKWGQNYPLRIARDQDEGLDLNRAFQETPALALYKLACAQEGDGCLEKASLLTKEDLESSMLVRWGRNVSPVMEQNPLLAREGCETCEQDAWTMLCAFLGTIRNNLFYGLSESFLDDDSQSCPYAITVSEADLDAPSLRGFFNDRIVLIGVALEGLDVVTSPVHGNIPGVYYHAMALDNLMTWGRNFEREPGTLEKLLWSLFVGALLSSMVAMAMRGSPCHGKWAVFPAMAVIMVLFEAQKWRIAAVPLNWLQIIVLSWAFLELAKECKKE